MKRLLICLFVTAALSAQVPMPKMPREYKPNPNASWSGGKWACPDGYRLPRDNFPSPEQLKDGQKVPCFPLPPYMGPGLLDPHGIWDAPQTFVDLWWMELTGHLVWRHYKVSYLPMRGNLYCKVENMTHHLPEYFDHDPKNLILTPTSFEFDAVAGDLIAWKVWSR